MRAQDINNNIYVGDVKEEYLVNLFQHAEIIFCKIDTLDDNVFMKNMEVAFLVDSSVFAVAYMASNYYTCLMPVYSKLWCTYVDINGPNGNAMKLQYQAYSEKMEEYAQPLNDLEQLQPVLDSLLQNTDPVDHYKDTRLFLDIDD